VTLRRGFADILHLPQPIDSIRAELSFDQTHVKILNFVARTGGGRARVEGELTYRPSVRVSLSMSADGVRVGYEPVLDLTVEQADLFVIGSLEKLFITGEVSIAEAVVSKDVDLNALLLMLRKKTVGVKTFQPAKEWIELNVAVRAEKGIVFRSNLAEIELSADMMLVGTNQKLGLLGTVGLVEGWAEMLNNRYTLTNAIVQFYDPNRIFPLFDINAETSVQDILIRVNISGTPDRWQIVFSSEPPRSEQDIVALLSLGVDYETFRQSGMTQTTSEEVAYRAAAQLLGSSVNKFVGKYAQMTVDIDTSHTPNRLMLSTDLGRDLSFRFYRDISGSGMESQLEYSFFPLISVLGDWRVEPGIADELGAVGGGLKFKLVFK